MLRPAVDSILVDDGGENGSSLKALAGAVCVCRNRICLGFLVWNFSETKTDARWLVSSRRYKAEVYAQPIPTSAEFKHIEWDGWGWAGQDTTVYLVFDPADSLSLAASTHLSDKFAGIPCEVPKVSRLESQWYVVTFYTNQDWGRCN